MVKHHHVEIITSDPSVAADANTGLRPFYCHPTTKKHVFDANI